MSGDVSSEVFLTKKQAAARLGVSWSTMDRWVKNADFPKPINLGARVRFLESEINGWMRKKIDASRSSGSK